jgi:hypothetical protein
MVPLLLGLGVRELSVSVPSIAAVKQQVRRLDTARLVAAAARALRAASAEEVLDVLSRIDPEPAPDPAPAPNSAPAPAPAPDVRPDTGPAPDEDPAAAPHTAPRKGEPST